MIDAAIAAVQTSGNKRFTDRTHDLRNGLPLRPWGLDALVPVATDPEAQPALYLGFGAALPPGEPVTLRFAVSGPAGPEERRRIAAAFETVPPHHSIRSEWDFLDGSGWKPLTDKHAADDTRGFTLDGSVVVTLPSASAAKSVGTVTAPLHYLRCRLVAGPLDYAPAVIDVAVNAVEVEQASAATGKFLILPGVKPPADEAPAIGKSGRLSLVLDASEAVVGLALSDARDGPQVTVLDYRPALATLAGSLTLTLLLLGRGTGLPGLELTLADAPVAGSVALWTLLDGKFREWRMRPDLDASARTDADFTLSASSGEIRFGDGERGAVVPLGATIFASYSFTAAAAGKLSREAAWRLPDDVVNRGLLEAPVAEVNAALTATERRGADAEGTDEESIDRAAGRAAETLWAHERLLDLAQGTPSFDGRGRDRILALAAPQRAATLLDYERVALDVPGAPVARARAWAGLDPDLPCATAPGTVVVAVVPWLPAARPQASAALLATVRRYLDRHRLVGTRLRVVAPTYRIVGVSAVIAVHAGASSDETRAAVVAALDRFLDPLQGGLDGSGWPFGRDVYRSEILAVIDGVSGVDHVEDLALVADGEAPQCGNVCTGPLALVAPGTHAISLTDRSDDGHAA